MYQQNQPRPGYVWRSGAYHGGGAGRQQEVRILSSTGFGVSGGVGGQGVGGMSRSSQNRGMSGQLGHFQGSVVIAGQGYRNIGQGVATPPPQQLGYGQVGHRQAVEESGGLYRSGSVGSGGYSSISGTNVPGGRSQSLSTFVGQGGGYTGHVQRYSQHRAAYQPVPRHQAVQLVPAPLPSSYHQRVAQVLPSNSFTQRSQLVSSPYSQVQATHSYPQQLASTPATPGNTSGNTVEAAAPENPFLSAFEKSFESFLNSKFSDDVAEPPVTKHYTESDPNSTESISSILNNFSQSKPSPVPYNTMNMSNSNGIISRQPTLPKSTSYSHPKPIFTSTQHSKTLQSPSITNATTFVQSKPVQNRSIIQGQNVFMPSNAPQPNKMSSSSNMQVRSLPLSAKNTSLQQASNGLAFSNKISSSSPQVGKKSKSSLSRGKVETVVIDDPEEKAVTAEIKPSILTTESDRRFQCNSCPKSFKSNGHLREHEITHTGNYPFNCETCKKGFKRENLLNSHKCLIKEEKARPFKCEDCNKGYATKQGLTRGHKCSSTKEGTSTPYNQQKRASIPEGSARKKLAKYEEEELIGDIVESVEVEVPVVVKDSEIVFTDPSGIAMIIGDLIEYQDFDTKLEDAEFEGWEIEVVGDENIILEENIIPIDNSNQIPDGIEEIARVCGLTPHNVKDTLEFFNKDFNENLEDQSSYRFPRQNIPSDLGKEENTQIETKSKEELLLCGEKDRNISNTLEELNMGGGKDSSQVKVKNPSLNLNKFTYFNDKLETTVEGGSGEDSDDEWTLSKNKCNLCKKKFSTKWHLKKHSKVHSDRTGTYKCLPCKRSFKRKDLRERHKCEGILNESVDNSFNTTLNDDIMMSSNDESFTLDEKADLAMENTGKRPSLLLHSTLI